MKNSKGALTMKAFKCYGLVLLSILLCVSMIAIPACAAITSQDGIEITLTTDKDEYKEGDKIKATVEVTNTNEEGVAKLSLSHILPEGYIPLNGASTDKPVEWLEPGETVSFTLTYVSGEAEAADTVVNDNDTKTLVTDTSVKVGSKELKLKASVSYQKDSDNVGYTRGEWISVLIDAYGYPESVEVTLPSYSDISGTAYEQAIEVGVAYGLLFADGEEFRPNDAATREFAAITAIRALGYQPNDELICDDAGSVTYPEEIALAIATGALSLEDNLFYPERALHASEADSILDVVEEHCDSTDGDDGENEGLIFNEEVIQIDESVEYTDDGYTLTLPATDELSDLQENDIIVIGHSVAYKILSATFDAGFISIQYTKPELYEIMDAIDLEGVAYMDFSQFVPAEGVTVNYNSSASAPGYSIQPLGFMDDAFDVPDTAFNPGIEIVLEGEIELDNGWELTYSFSEKVPSVSYKFDIDFDALAIFTDDPVANVKNAYVKMQQEAKLKVGFKKDMDEATLRDDMLYEYIELGSVPVVGVDGVGIVVEIDLVMNAEGTFEYEYTLKGTIGCQVVNNRPRNISTLQGSSSVSLTGQVKVGPQIGIVAEVFGEDLLSFSADAGVRVGGSLAVRSTGMVCFDAGITLYAEINAFEDTLIDDWLSIKTTWKIWDENNSPLKLGFHFEDMVKVPQCTYNTGGRITGTVADADNRTDYISGAKIQIYNTVTNELEAIVYSDGYGQYTAEVPEGTFLIKISADGYIPFESEQKVRDQQEVFVETFLMVEGEEDTEETGTVGGTVTDSVTGSSISSVQLTVREGWNKTSGNIVTTLTTDTVGSYQVDLPLGNYTIEMEHSNYVTGHINIAVTRNGNMNCHGTLVPNEESSVPTGDMRIVLTWGETPADLDSHLVGPTVDGSDEFHIYYSEKSYYYDGTNQAFLDVDDRYSYGPETTTIYNMNQNGVYSFYVHDFTNRRNDTNTALANSGAKVQVYVGEELVNTYNIPTSGVGNVWHVFDYNASTSRLTSVNRFSSQAEPQLIG